MLCRNKVVFALGYFDMLGIDSIVSSHKLNILPITTLIQQKVWCFHSDGHKIIQTEVDKLLKAKFIRKVTHSNWLSNVVVVPKKDKK